MEQNKNLDLQSTCEQLLEKIRAYGIKEVSIEHYKIVLNKIASFAREVGYASYYPELKEAFDIFIDTKVQNGSICYGYARFHHRVIRMLDSFVKTGEPDFSATQRNHRMYKVSLSSSDVIQKTLDYHGLQGEARTEMDTVLRHLFSYAEKKQESENTVITDDLLLDFFTKELPITNKGSMGRSLRAIKYLSAYLKTGESDVLKLDFTQLTARSSHVRIIPPYSQAEIKSAIDAIDTSTVSGMRDRAIILLAFDTGLRGIDIRNLCFTDIDWNQGKVLIRQSKTNHPLLLPLGPKVMNAIAEYILHARPESGYKEIFLTTKAPIKPLGNSRYAFSGISDKYFSDSHIEKIPGRGFHSLRRTFAVELSEAGVPLETISQLLGHKSIEEDKPYLSYNREQVSFCALDFEKIPIVNGIYAGGGQNETK